MLILEAFSACTSKHVRGISKLVSSWPPVWGSKKPPRMYLLQKYDALSGLDHAEFISKDVPPWHISDDTCGPQPEPPATWSSLKIRCTQRSIGKLNIDSPFGKGYWRNSWGDCWITGERVQAIKGRIFIVLKVWMKHMYFWGWWFQTFFIFIPYLRKSSNLTNIFQMGWNHQLDFIFCFLCKAFQAKGGRSTWSTPNTQNQTQPMKPEDSWNFSWPWGKGEEFGNAPEFFGFQRSRACQFQRWSSKTFVRDS